MPRIIALCLMGLMLGSCDSRIQFVELELSPELSKISFIGIKNNDTPVPGRFTIAKGSLNAGTRSGFVEVDLAGFETGVAARDENIRTHLFNAGTYPSIRFEVDDVQPEKIPIHPYKTPVEVELIGRLKIQDREVAMTIPARLLLDRGPVLFVDVLEPLVFTASQLGLASEFDALQSVCGHAALARVIPVELKLAFVPKQGS